MSEPRIDVKIAEALVEAEPRNRLEKWFGIDRHMKEDFKLEIICAMISLAVITALVFVSLVFFLIDLDKLQPMIAVVAAGFTFLIGQMYGRAKDRRESKRKKALEIFYEWHSKDIRDSRIYISHWMRFRGGEEKELLPTLGSAEAAANAKYKERRDQLKAYPEGEGKTLHELDDGQLMELHFFRIYQFFERWALLVKNRDIEARDADRYMRAYKPWYFWKFIDEWTVRENDPYIKISLDEIQKYVKPDLSEEPSFDEQIKAVEAEMLARGIRPSSMPESTCPAKYDLPG